MNGRKTSDFLFQSTKFCFKHQSSYGFWFGSTLKKGVVFCLKSTKFGSDTKETNPLTTLLKGS